VWSQIENRPTATVAVGDDITLRHSRAGSYILTTTKGIETRVRRQDGVRLVGIHGDHVRSNRVHTGLRETHFTGSTAEVDEFRDRPPGVPHELHAVVNIERPAVCLAWRAGLVDRPYFISVTEITFVSANGRRSAQQGRGKGTKHDSHVNLLRALEARLHSKTESNGETDHDCDRKVRLFELLRTG
jgi:hypothetical protein